jgi:prepilin-type N-terminal cleavage/methylation domain-containing protein
MTHRRNRRHEAGDQGFTLIEIVVAMLILGVLSLALLPLLINGITISAKTASIASATQIVNTQLGLAGSQSPTCTAVLATPIVPVGAASAYRGVPLHLATTFGACPVPAPSTTTPGTISVTATVTRTDTHAVLSKATLLVLVSGG